MNSTQLCSRTAYPYAHSHLNRIYTRTFTHEFALPKWYEERKAATIKIQAQYRGSVRRHWYKQVLRQRFDAACLLQARARGMAQRKRYRETLRRREAASIELQRHWRGRMVRCPCPALLFITLITVPPPSITAAD